MDAAAATLSSGRRPFPSSNIGVKEIYIVRKKFFFSFWWGGKEAMYIKERKGGLKKLSRWWLLEEESLLFFLADGVGEGGEATDAVQPTAGLLETSNFLKAIQTASSIRSFFFEGGPGPPPGIRLKGRKVVVDDDDGLPLSSEG